MSYIPLNTFIVKPKKRGTPSLCKSRLFTCYLKQATTAASQVSYTDRTFAPRREGHEESKSQVTKYLLNLVTKHAGRDCVTTAPVE